MNSRRKYKRTVKEIISTMSEIISALKRISTCAIAQVGDSCKMDLKTLAYASGLTDNQIHENFPEFFREEDPIIDIFENSEDENLEENKNEDENLEEEEKIEE